MAFSRISPRSGRNTRHVRHLPGRKTTPISTAGISNYDISLFVLVFNRRCLENAVKTGSSPWEVFTQRVAHLLVRKRLLNNRTKTKNLGESWNCREYLKDASLKRVIRLSALHLATNARSGGAEFVRKLLPRPGARPGHIITYPVSSSSKCTTVVSTLITISGQVAT